MSCRDIGVEAFGTRHGLGDGIGRIRDALVDLLAGLDGDAPRWIAFGAEDAHASRRHGAVVCSAVPGNTATEVDVLLGSWLDDDEGTGSPSRRVERLLRLGFVAPEPAAPAHRLVHAASIRTVDAPNRLARRIAAVLRLVHGAPRDAWLTIETQVVPEDAPAPAAGSRQQGQPQPEPCPRRTALEALALAPDDEEALAAFRSALDGWSWLLPDPETLVDPSGPQGSVPAGAERLVPVHPGSGADAGPLVRGCDDGSDPCTTNGTVTASARDLLAWVVESGPAAPRLVLDPHGPAPLLVDRPLAARLLGVRSEGASGHGVSRNGAEPPVQPA